MYKKISINQIDIEKAVHLDCLNRKYGCIKESTLKIIAKIILKVFFKSIIFKTQESSDKILFLNDRIYASKRKDLKVIYENIKKTTSQYSNCELIRGRAINTLLEIALQFKTIFTYSKDSSLYRIYQLLQINEILFQLNKSNFSGVRLLVVFFDPPLWDNVVVQYFKLCKVPTATTQHGVMLKYRNDLKLDFCAPEFSSFVSDYYLIWNLFTKNQAVMAGIPIEKLIVCGISRCLFKKPLNSHIHHFRFGVILDGKFTKENNWKMVLLAEELAQLLNSSFVLRIHPSDNQSDYSEYIKSSYCVGFSMEKDIEEYVRSVDFSIVCNSTALFEFAFYRHKFLRIKPVDYELDKYTDSKIINIDSASMALELLSNYQSESMNEFSNTDDIASSYNKFFNNFI